MLLVNSMLILDAAYAAILLAHAHCQGGEEHRITLLPLMRINTMERHTEQPHLSACSCITILFRHSINNTVMVMVLCPEDSFTPRTQQNTRHAAEAAAAAAVLCA